MLFKIYFIDKNAKIIFRLFLELRNVLLNKYPRYKKPYLKKKTAI